MFPINHKQLVSSANGDDPNTHAFDDLDFELTQKEMENELSNVLMLSKCSIVRVINNEFFLRDKSKDKNKDKKYIWC